MEEVEAIVRNVLSNWVYWTVRYAGISFLIVFKYTFCVN